MLRSNILLTFLFCVLGSTFAQDRIYLSGTVGTYSMKMMKDFQDDVAKSMDDENIQLKPVIEFPMSLQVSGGFLRSLNENNYAGGYINYAFTKGRLHYSDYSGETYFDQFVRRAVLGAEFRNSSQSGWYFYLRVGFDYSWLKLVSGTEISGGGKAENSSSFYSIGVDAEPGFGWEHTVYKQFAIGFNAGFDINYQGKTFFSEDHNAYLLDGHGDAIKLSWSGARVGLAVTYVIGK